MSNKDIEELRNILRGIKGGDGGGERRSYRDPRTGHLNRWSTKSNQEKDERTRAELREEREKKEQERQEWNDPERIERERQEWTSNPQNRVTVSNQRKMGETKREQRVEWSRDKPRQKKRRSTPYDVSVRQSKNVTRALRSKLLIDEMDPRSESDLLTSADIEYQNEPERTRTSDRLIERALQERRAREVERAREALIPHPAKGITKQEQRRQAVRRDKKRAIERERVRNTRKTNNEKLEALVRRIQK